MLIPHLHGRHCEQLIDYLIQNLPQFHFSYLPKIWMGLAKVKMGLLDPELSEKVQKLQGLFHSCTVEKVYFSATFLTFDNNWSNFNHEWAQGNFGTLL